MAHESIVQVTPDNIEEVKGSSVPVLIKFYNDYWGPCKSLAPVVDEVAAELGDGATVAKVDTGAQMALAQEFGVRNLPTLVFVKDGEEKDRHVGIMMKDDIVSKLQGL